MRAWFRALDRVELWGMLVLAAMLFLAAGAPLGISLAVTPDQIESGSVRLSPPCAYFVRTGRPCPTCGLTRGLSALVHGDFVRAQHYNQKSAPLGALLVLSALGALALGGASFVRLRSRTSPSPRSAFAS